MKLCYGGLEEIMCEKEVDLLKVESFLRWIEREKERKSLFVLSWKLFAKSFLLKFQLKSLQINY